MAMDGNHDFPTRGPVVLAVTATMVVCSTIFVVLRLMSRFWIVQKPGWDDYTIILAWILAFGTSFATCYGTSVGLGRHEVDVPDKWDSTLKKAEYTFSVLYNPSLMATKTSILLFYLTLSKTSKVFRWATIGTLVIVNVGGLALTLLNILQCQPVTAAFKTPVPDSAKCTDIVSIYLSSAPLNIVTDLILLFLPMPVLTAMRLPKKQKAILVVTFGFGVFVAVVDVVRIAYLQSAAKSHLEDLQHRGGAAADSRDQDNDFSWYASLTFMWSAIEINVGLMCACVPALKPLVSRFLPRWIHDATIRGSYRGSYSYEDSAGMHPDFVAARRGSKRQSAQLEPLPTRPPPAAQPALNGTQGPMDMMDFLTTPDMNDLSQPDTAPSTAGNSPPGRKSSTPAFFDFVDVKRKKNITLMTNQESVFPIAMVTVLFFIWGFAYGLLDTLNAQFQRAAHMTEDQTVGQHSAYYLGYFIGPLTFGRLVFKHWGFKACYMVGLMIYACGTLVFWPAAVLTSFPAFLISNFIVGLGLSTLEISANPFISLCGPPEYAEVRLNLSQAVQGVGSILSPLLAKKVLFKLSASAVSLIDVQWTYLGIAFFTIVLAIVYYYVPLPEASDDELEEATARLPIPRDATFSNTNVKIIWITLGLGVFSQFCYTGGQEAVATRFSDFMNFVSPQVDAVNHQIIAHTAFAVSRFGAAVLTLWIKPRYLLLFFYLGAIAFAAACMNGRGANPSALLIMTVFFEGPIFPLVFVQSIRGLGRNVKEASVLLTAAIGGGAVFPPIMFRADKARNPQFALIVVAVAFACGTFFPIWLNTYPDVRKLSDPVRDEQARIATIQEQESREQHNMTLRKRFSTVINPFSKRRDSELPVAEYRHRDSEQLSPTDVPPQHSPDSNVRDMALELGVTKVVVN